MRTAIWVACALLLAGQGFARGGDRPIVAVFDVELKRVKLPTEVQDSLADYLAGLLGQHGYRVVPRSQLAQRLRAQKTASFKECFDETCQIELGKELAADMSLSTQVMRLGGKCRVTLALFDLRRAASERTGVASGPCDENGVVAAIEEALKAMLKNRPGGDGQAVSASPDKRPGEDISSLERWEVLNGQWWSRGGAILGRGLAGGGSHLILRSAPMSDYVLDVTVEHLSGPRGSINAGCRYSLYEGGPMRRFRGGTTDIQGPCIGFDLDGKATASMGRQGKWTQVAPAGGGTLQVAGLKKSRVRVRSESRGGMHRLYVDGALAIEFEDRTYPSGLPLLYLGNPYGTVRFSDIRLYRPGSDAIPPAGPPAPVAPRALGQVEDLTDLNKFEVLNGRWWFKDGAIYGSGGHLLLKGEPFQDFDLEFTVEHVSGPIAGVSGAFRHEIVPGASKVFRGGTAGNQGLAFNFSLAGTFMPFVGLGGNWYQVHPDWKQWKSVPGMKGSRVRVRIEARGERFRFQVNGQQADEFEYPLFREGTILFWVQDPKQVVRFYDIKLRRS